MKSSSLILIVTAIFSLFAESTSRGDEYAGKQWPSSRQISIDKIEHQPWDQLLQKYVDGNGLVNYRDWQKNKADRRLLKTYLETLSQANPDLKADHKAKLAYWINAYNAVTVEGMLRVYPTTSIRNHTAKLFGYNIWKNLYLYSGDSKINLDSIEHKVLRKMDEPRIHFAIVCASIGCPRLLNRAYTQADLETQLSTNATDFFSRSQNMQFDSSSRTLKLSSIMSWFGTDFGDSTSKQIRSVAPYFPEDAKKFVSAGKFSVDYLDYNWNINEQK